MNKNHNLPKPLLRYKISTRCSKFKLRPLETKLTPPPPAEYRKRETFDKEFSSVLSAKFKTERNLSTVLPIKMVQFHFGTESLNFNPVFNHKLTAFQYFYTLNERAFISVLYQFHLTISVFVSCPVSPSLHLMQNSEVLSRTAASIQLPYVTFCVCTTKY